MSIALALWLMLVVAVIAYNVGRVVIARRILQLVLPLLPMLEELSQAAEALGAELSPEARDGLDSLRKAAIWN